MRPRSEWHINENTHPPLITPAEAETLLYQLEHSSVGESVSRARRGLSEHLLTGLLRAPGGQLWEGWQHCYRIEGTGGEKGRYIKKDSVDQVIIDQIVADMNSDSFIDDLYEEAKKLGKTDEDDAVARLAQEQRQIDVQIDKAMTLALQLDDPAPAMRKVNELEARRRKLSEEMARLKDEQEGRRVYKSVTRNDVAQLVSTLAVELNDAERPRLKGMLQATVDKITLDPKSLDCQIHYRIAADRTLGMASPRGFEPLLPP